MSEPTPPLSAEPDPTTLAASSVLPAAPDLTIQDSQASSDKHRATSDVRLLHTFGLAVPLYTAVLLLALVLPDSISRLLLERGWIPHVIMVLSCWSLAIIVLKVRALKSQRQAFMLELLPESAAHITPDNVGGLIEHLRDVQAVRPRRSRLRWFLVERVRRLLEHYAARRDVTETATINSADADADAVAVAASFSTLKVLVWAIPILGFIGTVIGISAAVGGFSQSLEGAEQLDAIKSSLGSVTAGLAVAFDTTLVALVASIIVMLPTSWLQKAEEQLANDVDDYCVTDILRRMVNPTGEPKQDESPLEPASLKQAIVEAVAPSLAEMMGAQSALLTKLAARHETLLGQERALNEQLGGAQAALSAQLGSAQAALNEQLGGAQALLNEQLGGAHATLTEQLAEAHIEVFGKLGEAHAALREQLSTLSATTQRLEPGIEQALRQLERATSLADRSTDAAGRSQEQLCRELGASRQLLQLLAAGLRTAPGAASSLPSLSSQPSQPSQNGGSNGSSSTQA